VRVLDAHGEGDAGAIARAIRYAARNKADVINMSLASVDPEAYQLTLQGRTAFARFTPDSLRDAADYFTLAIAKDPSYALAWAGIADSRGQLVQWGQGDRKEEHLRIGLEAAKKAIELNPRIPEGYKALGLILRFSGDWEGASVALKKGLDADPRNTPILINLCVEAWCRADVAGAERYARRAVDIDPQEAFAMSWVGTICVLTGRHEEALSYAQRILRNNSTPFYVTVAYMLRLFVEAKRGDTRAMPSIAKEAMAAGARAYHCDAFLSLAAAIEGRPEEARRLLDEVATHGDLAFGSIAGAAECALRLGDVALATRLMTRSASGTLAAVMVRLDPALLALADEPEIAPRRLDATLVWPLEAPMIDAARFRMFRDIKVESALPER